MLRYPKILGDNWVPGRLWGGGSEVLGALSGVVRIININNLGLLGYFCYFRRNKIGE